MAPEVIAGEGDYDVKADIFSFGIILYELTFGHNPLVTTKGMGSPFSFPFWERRADSSTIQRQCCTCNL